MTDKAQITTIDEAKAALDEEIAEAQSTVDFYRGRADQAKAEVEGHERKLWALQNFRRRMEPPSKPTLVAKSEVA